MAESRSGKSGRGRSAAAEVERLTAEKEASEDKAFALSHRVATLEGRERDLNELIIGHRERIAALRAERESLGAELERERQEVGALRERERDLGDELAKLLARATSLEAERERNTSDLEAEQKRSERLERRASELDQQLAGARDRIASLESSRDRLNEELDGADRRAGEVREREAELTQRIEAHEQRIAELNAQVEEERRRAGSIEQRNAELASRLEARSERIADLEAGQESLREELESARREMVALYERERDVQNRSVTLHEQVARLEVEGEMVNRALREERAAHSALQQRETSIRPQLESARERIRALEAEHEEIRQGAAERERELQEKLEAVEEQVGRVRAHRETLERELTKEQGNRAKLKEQEAELETSRKELTELHERESELQKELTEVSDREGELQKELADLRKSESELQEDLAEAQARESDLQGTIDGLRQQARALELQRTNLLAERDQLVVERDKLRARLKQLESSRTYRVMRFTWRTRDRIRHPFKRSARPALGKAPKRAKREKPAKPAELAPPAQVETPAEVEKPAEAPSPAPARERPKVRPMPAPAMRKPSKPSQTAEAEAKTEAEEQAAPEKAPEEKIVEAERAAEPAAEPAQQPEQAPAPEPAKAPAPAPTPPPAPVLSEEDLERERWLAKAQAPPANVRQLRVAAVLDEMSAACFEPDCDLLRIDSEGWAEQLEAHEPHLLLVESTWQGNNGSWQYMVASYTHPDYIGLPNLKALIAWCRERDIPTVFWNKEDPVHFERFKEAAALFDYIFTSDANCIDRYAALEREGSGPISSLQFAAQPRIHNPVAAPIERNPNPVFAGAYYRDRHIDRQKSLQMLLDAAMPFGLEIYDRRFGHQDKAFGFPERFLERVKGALPYDQVIEAYKSHRTFLNVNSVHDSPTMFSRRVFELLACGTAVVSTESVGVEQTLGDVVSMVETQAEATEALRKLQDDAYWRELSMRGRRRVIGEHTYRHRLAELANTLGFNVAAYPGEEVAAVALVDDVEQARKFRAVVSSISAQETRPAELLIGSHTSVAGDLQELSGDGNEIRVRVVQQDPETTRSQRFRELASLAASPWLAVLHPAHTYGEHHLTDLVLATRYADADVIGNASFETTAGSDAIDRSLENRFVESVHPHSVLVKRDLIETRGWPDDASGEPLGGWFRQGVRIYSSDAGNFRADAAIGLPERAASTGP
jgi:predicted  nucleic acid-binding Zn-ribbon protein